MHSERRRSKLCAVRRLLLALPLALACTESSTEAPQDVTTAADWFFPFDFGPPADLSGGNDGDDVPPPPDAEDGEVEDTDDVEPPDVCAPQCGTAEAPRVCGDDGCGGTCGTCEEGTTCIDGACALVGGSCSSPVIIESTSGVTTTRVVPVIDQSYCVDPADGASHGNGVADVAVQVQSLGGAALLKVAPGSTALLVPSNGCGQAATCFQAGAPSVVVAQGTSFVSLEATDPGPVDLQLTLCASLCAANSCLPNECGLPCLCNAGLSCRSDGSCAEAQPSEECSNATAVVLSATPSTFQVSLAGRTRDDQCTPAGAVDAVYALQTATDERVRVEVASDSPVSARLVTSCLGVDPGAVCDGAAAEPGTPVGVTLGASESAWLVVEGPLDASATVTLSRCSGCSADCPCFPGQACVAGVCVAPTTHDQCDSPLVLTAGKAVQHSLAKMTDDYRCFDGESGTDAVISFTAPSAGEYGLRLDSLHPLSAFELTRCGDPSSCARSVLTPTEVVLHLDAGQTTTWVVDRPVANLDSGFTARVTDCAAACQGAPCGTRACGRTCGCEGQKACVAGACVDAQPADTCDGAPTIQTVPAALSVDLNGLQRDYSCRGRGAASPDAVVRFIAPHAGTYVAKVSGLGAPVVYRPTGCGTEISTCIGRDSDPVLSQEFFFVREGETVLLVLDRLAPEGLTDGTVSLVVASVTGVAGGLGSACTASSDCSLAERCLFGVCTLSCNSNDQCGKGVAGPRGTVFGCPTDVCLPGPSGCSAYCTAGSGGDIACSDDASCGGQDRCTGFALSDADTLVPFCATAGTLSPRGAPCTSSAACASNLCVLGACREPCASNSACSPTERCLGTVGETVLGGKKGITGVCLGAKDLGGTCTLDADCPGGSCDAVLGPKGETQFVCRTPPTGAQFAFNEICATNSNCSTGRCLYGEVLGLLDAYCTSGCSSDLDCHGGTVCRDVSIWDADTPENPADDVTLPLCVRGAAGSGCLPHGVNTCDPGLLCAPTATKPEFGLCAQP